MESMGMDPELTTEMIKLLGQELKTVRAQLREAEMRSSTPYAGGPSNGLPHEVAQTLVTENDALRADVAALQERVVRLQDDLRQVPTVKWEEGTEPTPHTRADFARLLAENEGLLRDKEEASRVKEKFLALQDKYRQSKATVHEYNEARNILDDLRTVLSNRTLELEQSKKAVVPEIDVRDFLNDVPYESVEGQLELSLIPQFPCRRGKFPKNIATICNDPYFIEHNEVIWSPSGIALGLVIKPTFQYNPKASNGSWTKFEEDFEIGRQMDVCYFPGQTATARYLGVYQRVGESMVIAPGTLQHLDREKLTFISRRTTLFPNLMPPSQTQMINNMYRQGVIKLQCFMIQCIAYHQTVCENLQEMSTTAQRNSPDKTVMSVSANSGENVRKRKKDSRKMVSPNKKRKN